MVLAPYNDLDAARAAIATQAGRLAAIILEPMQGGGGCIPAEADFLHGLRAAADTRGRAADPRRGDDLAPGAGRAAIGAWASRPT